MRGWERQVSRQRELIADRPTDELRRRFVEHEYFDVGGFVEPEAPRIRDDPAVAELLASVQGGDPGVFRGRCRELLDVFAEAESAATGLGMRPLLCDYDTELLALMEELDSRAGSR